MIKGHITISRFAQNGPQHVSYFWIEDMGKQYILEHVVVTAWENKDDWKFHSLERARIDLPAGILSSLGL